MTETLPLSELRDKWAQAWGMPAHKWISRQMLERSLEFKADERSGGGLNAQEQKRLKALIKSYKRNPNYFEQGHRALKPGMRLVRKWQGKSYSITVTADGFYYKDKLYSSLSHIANEITGSRWNGWVFFGLKNIKGTS